MSFIPSFLEYIYKAIHNDVLVFIKEELKRDNTDHYKYYIWLSTLRHKPLQVPVRHSIYLYGGTSMFSCST